MEPTPSTATTAQQTTFTRDVLGRYVCNGLDEARFSTDRSRRPDARPFDVVIVGGGTFGAALAEHVWFRDKAHRHRILVLEGGPFVLPEHVQNLPVIGLGTADATSLADLQRLSPEAQAGWRKEVWGLAWHSDVKFPGLAYCLGGRSLYWGGWSPRLLDTELAAWPPAVVSELESRYFAEAEQQIGVSQTNDFIYGDLQNALRQQLYASMAAGKITEAIALGALPDHPAARDRTLSVNALRDLLGLPGSGGTVTALRDELKLEAPLAVQGRPPRAGFFPLNKFSALPLLMKAAREAQAEAQAATPAGFGAGDDVKKRLMVVPNCHVTRLVVEGDRVTRVLTNQGEVAVPPDGVVIVALGTVESTRLALNSFGGVSGADRLGRNLIAHLRSNLTIRVPRTALTALDPQVRDLQAAALFVKGRHAHTDGSNRVGHFHLQITAAGLEVPGTDSEAELFKKIPDLDTLDRFRLADDKYVVVTIRGIGEMESLAAAGAAHASRVTLDPNLDRDEFGVPRAFVSIQPTARDRALWDAMDRAADDVAQALAGYGPFEIIGRQRDGLGTTHHEGGTLAMGPDPASSVTDIDGAFHAVPNVYVAGPAVFPSGGSPNPMLTGIALVRRLGDRLSLEPAAPVDAGFTSLFSGTSLDGWRMSTIRNQPGRDDPGRFVIIDGALEAVTGTDIGLLWHTTPTPPNFVLRLEWRRWADSDNSGVFVRFPHPESRNYGNSAFVAVDFGFEIQIDQQARPDGAPIHETGAIYGLQAPANPDALPVRGIGEWNEYEISVTGQTYTVALNGQTVTTYQNANAARGLPSTGSAPAFIGIQTHTGRVDFRNIRIKPLP